MNTKLFLSLIFVCVISTSFGQKSTKSFFTPTKIGFHYNYGNEKNFLFDDTDYSYTSQAFKGQLFFPITTFKGFQLHLVFQPQVQLIQHQLLNEQFIRPNEQNYLEKRARFTKLKTISLYGGEFSLNLERKLFKSISFFIEVGLGFSYIDTETERLAKGFTFIENGNFGLSILLNKTTSIQIHAGLGHVSNFNFQLPNSGYNIFNTGIGFQYKINRFNTK